MRWRLIWFPLRVIISGVLLIYLIWRSDPVTIWQSWQQAHFSLILLAMALQVFGVALSAAKWWVLLYARGQQQPYLWLLGAYLAGQFANNFLPTTVGGDALRITQLGRRIGSYSEASASVFVERLTGFLALSLIANLALVAGYYGAADQYLAAVPGLWPITVVFMLAAIAAMVVTFAAPQLEQRIGWCLPAIARRLLHNLSQALANYIPRGRWLALVLGLSLLFQALWVSIHAICGVALAIEAPLLLYAMMTTLTDILGLVPIFLNNLGAREVVFTFSLAQVGVAQETALALAVMLFAVRLVVSLLGGLVVLIGGANLAAARVAHHNIAATEP